MTYYILPQIEYNIRDSNIKLVFSKKDQPNKNNYSLQKYLSKIKSLIDKHIQDWDQIKKYTNPYEFVHTTIPGQKFSVSKYKPISRAFFKIMEIYNTHHLLHFTSPINTFHLAEGPGGFIESTAYIRDNKLDKYNGITLLNKNGNIPDWKKAENIINKYGNINIEYGVNNKGDLYNYQNLEYCKKEYRNSMHIITGDGGFDFSGDYNNQEKAAFRLILTQVAYAITMQKHNGHFILKIFDMFENCTIQIVFLLSCLYENVIISKPFTSRYANSEKYLICKNFKYNNTDELSNRFLNILKFFDSFDFKTYDISSILNLNMHSYYKNQIKEINAILAHQQIDNILTTIKIITHKDRKNDKIQSLKSQNIQKCITWCSNNKISYNKNYQTNNIFLGERTRNFKTSI
jgi:23S rRNA U2552 (ribose-2'-O)-methylase RlmE/FtsJ